MLIRYLLGLAALLLCSMSSAVQLGVLAPIIQDKQPLMLAPPKGGEPAPVLMQLRSGKLFQALQQEAQKGFTGTMLGLDSDAMRIAGQGKITWLMLAVEDGGFARRGFWLREGASQRWIDEPFVDLVVDEDSIADGSFEEIFAHELGHVFLRRLLPNLPLGYSRTAHHSFSVTDQQTAFDEGFATHFQALARRYTHNERLRNEDLGVVFKAFTPLWQSNLDRQWRIDGVRQNLFVHQQVTPPGTGEGVARREQSTLFDRARLKNGAQMLASEGFVATVFYRAQVAGVASYAPLFTAFKKMSMQPLTSDTALLPLLAQSYPALTRTLAETSYGVLGAPSVAALVPALALAGRFGDAEHFVPSLKLARAALAAPPGALDAGPAVWLAVSKDLFVDLNTAELEHLLALPGVSAATAERALASRAQTGPFASLADFALRAGIADAAPLAALAAAALKAGPNSRN